VAVGEAECFANFEDSNEQGRHTPAWSRENVFNKKQNKTQTPKYGAADSSQYVLKFCMKSGREPRNAISDRAALVEDEFDAHIDLCHEQELAKTRRYRTTAVLSSNHLASMFVLIMERRR